MKKINKNTFVVNVIAFLCDYKIFDRDIPGMTCMAVSSINGVAVKNDSFGMHKAYFPNPGAARIKENIELLRPVMGTEMACTIVEYNDKDSGNAVVTLFPNGMLHIHKPYHPFTYHNHLNGATNADLKEQRDLRLFMTSQALRRRQK